MENLKQKNESSFFVDDLSEISGKLVEQKQLVDFDNKFKRKLKWHQKIFNIKSPWVASMLKAFAVILEFFLVAFIVITITFFLINSVPGGTGLTAGLDEAARRAVEEKYGLNQPLIIRYAFIWKT